jgi:hypothetical protein
MNKALFCVGVCAMIAAYGCAAETADDDAVDAERVAVDVAPIVGGVKTTAYPAAALLNMRAATGASYACTATVIAPRVVLTAGHCVDGMVAWEVIANGSLRTSTKGETYDWHENGATTVNPLHHDLGLVYLTDPIVLPSYPTLATQVAAVGAAAIDVGRIRNAAVTNEIYSAPITLRSGLTVGFPFDYAAAGVIEHGDSGGPVFLGATQTLVAVNSGLGGNTEVLARVDLLADWLRGRIAAQAAAPPPPPKDAGAPKPDAEPPKDAGAPKPDAEPPKDAGAPKPDAGAPAPPPPPPPSACAITESEPNNVIGSATAFKTTACGKLGTADDLDWFLHAAVVGKTTLLLGSDGDAAASFGVLSAGKCVPFVQSARGVVVNVIAGTAQICIGVSSAAHKAQPYGLSAVR